MLPHVAQFLRAIALEMAYPSVRETGATEQDFSAAAAKFEEAAEEWRRARSTWAMVGVLVLVAAGIDVWNANRRGRRG